MSNRFQILIVAWNKTESNEGSSNIYIGLNIKIIAQRWFDIRNHLCVYDESDRIHNEFVVPPSIKNFVYYYFVVENTVLLKFSPYYFLL